MPPPPQARNTLRIFLRNNDNNQEHFKHFATQRIKIDKIESQVAPAEEADYSQFSVHYSKT